LHFPLSCGPIGYQEALLAAERLSSRSEPTRLLTRLTKLNFVNEGSRFCDVECLRGVHLKAIAVQVFALVGGR